MAPSPAKLLVESPSRVANGRIGVFVADDSRMGCQLLEHALKRFPHRFNVLRSAVTRSEILSSLNQCDVDVALVSEDLQDGRFMGFQVLPELHASFPRTRVIVLLNSLQNDLVLDAFRAGAVGVFSRAEPFEMLCKCIEAVHAGQVWANSAQLRLILGAFINAAPFRLVQHQGLKLLAKREAQVVELVVDGLTNRQTGVKLGISEHTVSNYLFRIYNKLGISSRVELVLYVIRQRETGQLLDSQD